MKSLIRELEPEDQLIASRRTGTYERTIVVGEPLELPVESKLKITLLAKTGRRARLLVERDENTIIEHIQT